MLVTNHLLYNSDIRISHTFYSSSVQSVVLFSFFLTYLFWHQFIVMSVQCYFSHYDIFSPWYFFIVNTFYCDINSLWCQFIVISLIMTSFHCYYFLVWHQFMVTSFHCNFSSFWHLFIVTFLHSYYSLLWHQFMVTYFHCDISIF